MNPTASAATAPSTSVTNSWAPAALTVALRDTVCGGAGQHAPGRHPQRGGDGNCGRSPGYDPARIAYPHGHGSSGNGTSHVISRQSVKAGKRLATTRPVEPSSSGVRGRSRPTV